MVNLSTAACGRLDIPKLNIILGWLKCVGPSMSSFNIENIIINFSSSTMGVLFNLQRKTGTSHTHMYASEYCSMLLYVIISLGNTLWDIYPCLPLLLTTKWSWILNSQWIYLSQNMTYIMMLQLTMNRICEKPLSLTSDSLICCRIYASLGFSQLKLHCFI